MRQTVALLLLTLIGFGLLDQTPAETTNDDLRGTIQSLIYSYNQLDNKLERHEHRERALGELLKKALQSLQKGQKNLEPINGIFGRLDDRVSQIETMLITQEEKYNVQTEKLREALEHMFKWMHENNECYKQPPNGGLVLPPAALTAPTNVPDEKFMKQQEQLNRQLLEQLQTLTTNVDKLLDNSKDMMAQTEVAFRSVPSTAEMLTKIEDKLVSYSVATPAPAVLQSVDNSEFENKVFERFAELTSDLAVLCDAPQPQMELNKADKDFIHGLANETLSAVEQLKVNALSEMQQAITQKATELIKASEQRLAGDVERVAVNVAGSTAVLDKFYTEVNGSYGKLNEALEVFTRFNNILMTNSEYVLATQRKVEFGTIQIVQKIGDLLDRQREEVNTLLKERFDAVDESIVNQQLDAVQNLSAIIEREIGHVWRQISIMHGEITSSKDKLNSLSGRNEVFVNNTFNTLTTMGGKVEGIKGRMMDMDENLNFLLGNLSIISQEFKNIKVGLAESLDELRRAFHAAQDKLPKPQASQNAGPHTIKQNEYETEVNLLQKRHTTS